MINFSQILTKQAFFSCTVDELIIEKYMPIAQVSVADKS